MAKDNVGPERGRFNDIPPVDSGKDLLEISFRKGKIKANKIKKPKLKRNLLAYHKNKERTKVEASSDILNSRLNAIHDSFPDTRVMDQFYIELMKLTIDMKAFKSSLSAVRSSAGIISKLKSKYVKKINSSKDMAVLPQKTREFYGRASSVVKRLEKELNYLEGARRVLRKFPWFKERFTVCIFGFPNVGKTTLLSKLTGSRPEIASYAFTTTGINVGNITHNSREIQVLDTPGTLNRLDKMNSIEKQAYLAMKYLADMVIYVFDITEPFPLKDQIKLYRRVKDKNPLIYLSKQDMVDKDKASAFSRRYRIFDSDELKKEIILRFEDYLKKSRKRKV